MGEIMLTLHFYWTPIKSFQYFNGSNCELIELWMQLVSVRICSTDAISMQTAHICDLLTGRNIVPIHLFNTLYYSDITCNDLYWPGGKKWTCDFSHPVVGEKCKVQIKKHKIILKVKKKDSGVWKDLMVGITDTKRRC